MSIISVISESIMSLRKENNVKCAVQFYPGEENKIMINIQIIFLIHGLRFFSTVSRI